MTLNEIFRRSGEPTYYTPMAVVGQLVNQEGGTVVIGNPPFSDAIPYHKQHGTWRKGWAKKFRIGRLYFYISNCRMKKRPKRDLMYSNYVQDHCVENKRKLYERQGGKCPHCGQPFDYEAMELHHVLPLSRFPELGQSIRNGIMLCHRCHKEVHCNPWLNIKLMKAKAAELGIDLKDKYDYGEEECNERENLTPTTD